MSDKNNDVDPEVAFAKWPGILALYRDVSAKKDYLPFAEMILNDLRYLARNISEQDHQRLVLYDADCANAVAEQKIKLN